MKTKELISFLENFDENSEVEIEVCDAISREGIDSTFDIGVWEESGHPKLAITIERN